MKRNEITYCELESIIDAHIENETSINIICDKDLKETIADYLYEEYDIEDTEEDFDYDEYYVEIYFDEDGMQLFIESARGNNGEYKSSEVGNMNYFIFTDMTLEEADEYICGDAMFCELVECDECECNNECEDCDEEVDPELEYLIEKTVELLENDFCPNCAFDFVMEIFKCGYDLGHEDCKLETIDFLVSDED